MSGALPTDTTEERSELGQAAALHEATDAIPGVKLPSVVDDVMTNTEWKGIRERAKVVAKGKLTKYRTEEEITSITMAGRELGLPMFTSLRMMSMIEGKIIIEAQLLHALVLRRVQGAVIDILERTNERCVIECRRPRHKPTRFEFTIEDAEYANLTHKPNWKYRKSMLCNRAMSAACREYFPDAAAGCYTPEEMESSYYTPQELHAALTELRADCMALVMVVPAKSEEARKQLKTKIERSRDIDELEGIFHLLESRRAKGTATVEGGQPVTLTPDTKGPETKGTESTSTNATAQTNEARPTATIDASPAATTGGPAAVSASSTTEGKKNDS